jgi:DNA helicase-2/ATP-dependent DNA helicase PcrA
MTELPGGGVGPGGVAADYLAKLNPEQREAVETLDGPLLVLAGAGTGKTRVLTTRFAHILMSGRARPWEVLSVTFTNKAAREMRERISHILGRPVEGLWLGTFHALCARMLRRHAEFVGLKTSFTILDADDQLRLLKQVMDAAGVDLKRWPPQGLMAQVQRWKDRGLTPARVTPAEDTDYAGGRARALYEAYQSRLRDLNAADFGDLLLHVTEILRSRPEVLADYHRAFRYILVDEYQDTNLVQYLWLRLLAQREAPAAQNICCVGDDDQSIYSWRGAEIENILRFEKDFRDARIVRLEANYRSTRPILGAASGLIARNTGRLGKTLRPGRADSDGDKVRVLSLWDSEEEARTIGDRIEAARRSGHRLAEVAILVRAGFQTRSFEERLIRARPALSRGGRAEILRARGDPRRHGLHGACCTSRPTTWPSSGSSTRRSAPRRGRGCAPSTGWRATSASQLHDAALRILEGDALKPKPRGAIRELMQGFARWRQVNEKEGHVVAVATLLEESGYTAMWQADRGPEAPGRLENLKELLRALGDFQNLGGFLDHVALVMENDENAEGDRLQIMTLHAAKGLEFDTVFLPGWEEGLFPSQRSLDEGGEKALEEERRLAYVGITRARKHAIISHAANRRIYGNWSAAIPSRFLDELPEEMVVREGGAAMRAQRMADTPSVFGGGGLFARKPRVIEAGSWEVKERPAQAAAFARGERVFHDKFGYGTVTSVEDDRLDVAFDKAGDKRVLDRFLRPAGQA